MESTIALVLVGIVTVLVTAYAFYIWRGPSRK